MQVRIILFRVKNKPRGYAPLHDERWNFIKMKVLAAEHDAMLEE